MRQVFFYVPFTEGLVPPDGFPVPGFGIMLFLAFAVVTGWGILRCQKIGLSPPRTQDLAILLFITGIAGARIVYMIQYKDRDYPTHTWLEMVLEFFKIWNGGIVFYGSVFGGLIGYFLFRRAVLARIGVSDWQLVDAVAPLVAIGMAVGRIGCYLNGCCWGQVACEECQPVPLSAELGRFPLLTSHMQKQLTTPAGPSSRLPQVCGLQTTTGFSLRTRDPIGDPRTVVQAVEPGSDAAAAGLKAGDRIVGVNGKPNRIVFQLVGPEATVAQAERRLTDAGAVPTDGGFAFIDAAAALGARAKLIEFLPTGLRVSAMDEFEDMIRRWSRGRLTLDLTVDRDGTTQSISYVPRTVTFFPTQLYETVSMVLLTFLLVAFQPFRRHDGQVIVLLMVGYAVHRFLNEAIRIEPVYVLGGINLGLTLSQWISVLILLAAVSLEVYLRKTQNKLPAGLVPLGWKPA